MPDSRQPTPYDSKWRAIRRWPDGSSSWSGHRTWFGAWRAMRRRRAVFDRLDDGFKQSTLSVERNPHA